MFKIHKQSEGDLGAYEAHVAATSALADQSVPRHQDEQVVAFPEVDGCASPLVGTQLLSLFDMASSVREKSDLNQDFAVPNPSHISLRNQWKRECFVG
jgi:hypothetical protein